MKMLEVRAVGPVQLVTLDRPDRRNALHPDLVSSLLLALQRAEEDERIRAVVLTGAGTSFCAGLDLRHLAGLDEDGAVGYMRSAFALFRRVFDLRQPVIAAVNGPAMAGGFDLAAACDIRICGGSAVFAQTEILLGLTQIMYPVYKAVGLAFATELALTGRTVSAEEAHRVGFVSAVHPDERVVPAALELAGELARRPPQALFATKRLARELIDLDTDAAFDRMLDVITDRLRSDEHRAARDAYLGALGGGGRAAGADPAIDR